MGKRIIHYQYLAQDRIQVLYGQLHAGAMRSLAGQISVNLPVVVQLTFGTPTRKEPALTDQLHAVLTHLEKYEPEKIGTVDDPRLYIKGTLPMFSYLLPTQFLLKHRLQPEFIYYGGSTDSTILGLAGPVHNVIGRTQARADSEREVSSALPYLVPVLAEEHRTQTHYKSVDYDEGQALDAIEYMEDYNRQGKQLRSFSFLATLQLDSHNIDGWDIYNDKRIILASPIYMAYAD